MKNKKILKILLIALAVVTAGVIFTFVKDSASGAQEISEESGEALSEEGEEALSEDTEETSSALICVHVCGAVVNAGVYYLEEGARVHEAVEMAGGLTDEAAQEYINLASVLEDGQQIYIPTYDEALEQGLEIGSSSEESADSGLININTATSDELQTLPGIGETKAAAIITYRENNGDFASTEDITNVSGIGESTYENIKDYITV